MLVLFLGVLYFNNMRNNKWEFGITLLQGILFLPAPIYSWSYNILNKMSLNKKHKKYQYLYLKEKVDNNITHLQYLCADGETWSNFDDQCKRYDFYNDWLHKINKKYKYEDHK